jgi:phytanoyl-CoA hydroxylase
MQKLPKYPAPADGRLTAKMLADFRAQGVIVLEDFVTPARCRALREHTLDLIEQFDPAEVKHVFSAMQQTQLGDSYFEESGDKIRFFFESDAFDEHGELRQSKENSLNKIGHAMHDLDPVFDRFSRTRKLAATVDSLGYRDPVVLQSMYIFKPPRIGGEVYCHQDSTFLYTDPESCIGFWFALEDATIENGCMHFIQSGLLVARSIDARVSRKVLSRFLFLLARESVRSREPRQRRVQLPSEELDGHQRFPDV